MLDKLITEIDRGLKTLSIPSIESRPCPGSDIKDTQPLSESDKRKHAQLMRVNHSGEICAQALYRGQLLFNKNPKIQIELEKAASEEIDHLAWCEKRIDELDGKTSRLNPLLYAGSFAIGSLASIIDEKYNLGFLAETEKQVSAHLESHLKMLNPDDKKTLKILETMKLDEEKHQGSAHALGAKKLPKIIETIMKKTAKLMTSSTYHI
jgi:ubiquinone biosynthesis monooxygenase Coq7